MSLSAPTLLSIEATSYGVSLSWTAVAGASTYIIKYGTSAGVYTTEIEAGDVTEYEVTGLTNGVTYYFAVFARLDRLYLTMEGSDGSTTIEDSTGRHTPVANGGVEIDTAQAAVGNSSLLFPGATGDNVEIPDSDDWKYGSGVNYTIDFRVRFNTLPSLSSSYIIVGQGFSGNSGEYHIIELVNLSGAYRFRLVTGASWSSASSTITTGVWYRVRFKKTGFTLKIYLDGVQVGSDITIGGELDAYGGQSSRPLTLGTLDGGNFSMLDGWLDEFRWSDDSSDSNELSIQAAISSIDGTDYCPYVSAGKVRKLVSTVTGLYHLEGMSVSIVADGIYVGEKTVSNGSITLDDPAAVIHVGLKYRGIVIPLNLIVAGQLQNSISFGKNISSVALIVANTIGVKYGTSLYNLQSIEQPDGGEAATDPKVPFTGTIPLPNDDKWEEDKKLIYVQNEPYPCKLNAMNVTIEVGEK